MDDSWVPGANKIDETRDQRKREREEQMEAARLLKMDKKLEKLWKKAQASGFSGKVFLKYTVIYQIVAVDVSNSV